MEIVDGEIRHHGLSHDEDLAELLARNGDIVMIHNYLGHGARMRDALVWMFKFTGHESCYACKFYKHDKVHFDLCSKSGSYEKTHVCLCKKFKGVENEDINKA